MRQSSFMIRAFVAAGVLGLICIAAFSLRAYAQRAHTEANVSRLVNRNGSNSAVSPESLEAFTLVILKRVYFRYDESHLSSQEEIALNALVNSFPRDGQSVIELRGYTDGMESLHTGTTLGITRSQTIARYLMGRGIPAARILVVPTNGMSDDERSMNPEHRRVDIRVFTSGGSDEGGTYSAALNTSREAAKPQKGA